MKKNRTTKGQIYWTFNFENNDVVECRYAGTNRDGYHCYNCADLSKKINAFYDSSELKYYVFYTLEDAVKFIKTDCKNEINKLQIIVDNLDKKYAL